MLKPYYSFTTYKDAEDLKRLDFIVDAINSLNNPQAKVLDIGCGNGNISMALGSLGYNVTGVDIDIVSIEKANAKNNLPNVSFRILDANSFKLNDEYDAIVCSEVLEHLTDPAELLQSIYRILKPNGILAATVPNGTGPRELLITRPVLWFQKKGIGNVILGLKRVLGYSNSTLQSSNPDLTHVQFFRAGSFARMLQSVGFKKKKWSNAGFIEKVFPFSWFSRRIYFLQKMDCVVADYVPTQMSSGFYTSWTK
jgi:2-polyprenyl-3-methyl-5-hydroxy-6-metoxy-1,4-benzoquinol methylase